MNFISSLIELKDIRKTYRIGEREFPVLKGINLDIEEGEFIALMGPSGSGKSTLLNIMGCLDRPTSGHFMLLGQDVSWTSYDELARLRREDLGFIILPTRRQSSTPLRRSGRSDAPEGLNSDNGEI